MTIQQFLTKLIQDKNDYVMSKEDETLLRIEGLKNLIYKKLNLSKYKASATSKDYEQKVLDKIELCINHNLPIHFTLPFGAAKSPYQPTAPGVDWAEVMNIAYIREYLKPIAKVYKYGVKLEYISVGVFEEKMNRIPQKDVDIYDKEFAALIKYYQDFLPKNFHLNYSRVSDKYEKNELERLIDIKVYQLRKAWNNQSPETIEYKLLRAKRNCKWEESEKDLGKILLQSALVHDSFCSECWTAQNSPWDQKDMITLGHNYTSGWAIHVRSTPGSSVNFWSGTGALIKKGDNFIPTVLSNSQYTKLIDNFKHEKVSIFSDKTYLNLRTIPVVVN